jgi:hypothetical protein
MQRRWHFQRETDKEENAARGARATEEVLTSRQLSGRFLFGRNISPANKGAMTIIIAPLVMAQRLPFSSRAKLMVLVYHRKTGI